MAYGVEEPYGPPIEVRGLWPSAAEGRWVG
jgi:hypothetical protein